MLAAEQHVEPRPAAAFAAEQQGIVVESVAIHDRDRLGLVGDALQPVALRFAPAPGGQDPLQRPLHPLLIRHVRLPCDPLHAADGSPHREIRFAALGGEGRISRGGWHDPGLGPNPRQ